MLLKKYSNVLFQARYIILLMLLSLVLVLVDHNIAIDSFYNRERLAQGQWWRIWSAHLSHANFYHWSINMLAVIVIYSFFQPYFDKQLWLVTVLFFMPAISGGLYYFEPSLHTYMGFSGVIQAWFSFVVVRSFHETRLFNSLLLALQWGRIVYEHTPNYDIDYMHSIIDASVAVNAHLFGATSGVVAGVLSIAITHCAGSTRCLHHSN